MIRVGIDSAAVGEINLAIFEAVRSKKIPTIERKFDVVLATFCTHWDKIHEYVLHCTNK